VPHEEAEVNARYAESFVEVPPGSSLFSGDYPAGPQRAHEQPKDAGASFVK
jgi:hypothetical protein